MAEEGTELEGALNWAQVARRREPENPGIADTVGWIQHKLGRNTLARDQLQFAVSKDPDNPVYQYHLALIYKELKQTREAEAALKKALKTSGKFKERPLAEAALKDMASLK
jgi:predicted Zn-dependent protease